MEYADFGWALDKMRAGKRVFRSGWNGTGMWISLQHVDSNSKMSRPYIYLSLFEDNFVPWVASQSDLLETDWKVI